MTNAQMSSVLTGRRVGGGEAGGGGVRGAVWLRSFFLEARIQAQKVSCSIQDTKKLMSRWSGCGLEELVTAFDISMFGLGWQNLIGWGSCWSIPMHVHSTGYTMLGALSLVQGLGALMQQSVALSGLLATYHMVLTLVYLM